MSSEFFLGDLLTASDETQRVEVRRHRRRQRLTRKRKQRRWDWSSRR